MNWQEVCEHPSLQNLPFRIELNERGQIIMSPAKAYHSLYQAEISYLLRLIKKHGKAMVECAIRTRKGTKVADVAWVYPGRLEHIRYESECSVAPEICIEVGSSLRLEPTTVGNTDNEMSEKRQLYFENGAEEVWICSVKGDMRFYHSEGELEKSELVPGFPKKIEI